MYTQDREYVVQTYDIREDDSLDEVTFDLGLFIVQCVSVTLSTVIDRGDTECANI